METALANERAGLVAEAASNACTCEGPTADFAEGLRVGGWDDAWEGALGGVDIKEAEKLLVVLHGAQVHKHGTASVGTVGDVDLVLGVDATVQPVDEPGVDSAKGQAAFVVSLFDGGDVLDKPHQLDAAGVGAERQAARLGKLIGTRPALELSDEAGGAGVWPHDGVVEGFPRGLVPNDGSFPLVGDTY